MSVHTDQIASVLHRAVQDVLTRGLNDPRVRGLLSVTRVIVTDDLREAIIHISILPEDRAELAMHGIRHATRHIRTAVGSRVRLRRMPQLSFRLDETLKRQAGVEQAILAGRQSDEKRNEVKTRGLAAAGPEDAER